MKLWTTAPMHRRALFAGIGFLLFSFAFIALVFTPCIASEEALAVLRKHLEKDAKGLLLNEVDKEILVPGSINPGSDVTDVIDKYELSKIIRVNSKRIEVDVVYYTIGQALPIDLTYFNKTRKITERYAMVFMNGRWLMDPPIISPQIYEAPMLKYSSTLASRDHIEIHEHMYREYLAAKKLDIYKLLDLNKKNNLIFARGGGKIVFVGKGNGLTLQVYPSKVFYERKPKIGKGENVILFVKKKAGKPQVPDILAYIKKSGARVEQREYE